MNIGFAVSKSQFFNGFYSVSVPFQISEVFGIPSIDLGLLPILLLMQKRHPLMLKRRKVNTLSSGMHLENPLNLVSLRMPPTEIDWQNY
jgi:hypothetical protein